MFAHLTTNAQFNPDYSQNYHSQVSFWTNYYDSLDAVYAQNGNGSYKLPGYSQFVKWRNHWKMFMPSSGDWADAEVIYDLNKQYKTGIQLDNASRIINGTYNPLIKANDWIELGPTSLESIKTKNSANDWLSAHVPGSNNLESGNHVAAIRKLYKNPTNDDVLYALGLGSSRVGLGAGGVFFSIDGGGNWNVMGTDEIHLPEFSSLAVKPQGEGANPNEEYVFISHVNGKVYRMKQSEEVWIECSYNGQYCYPVKLCDYNNISTIQNDPNSLPFVDEIYNNTHGKKIMSNELDFAKKDANSSRYSRLIVSRDNGLFYTDNPTAQLTINGTSINNSIQWVNLCDPADNNSNLYSRISNIPLINPNAEGKHFQFTDFESYEKNGQVVYLAMIQTLEHDANNDYFENDFFRQYVFQSTDFGITWNRLGVNEANSPDGLTGLKFKNDLKLMFRPGNIEVKYMNPSCFYVVGPGDDATSSNLIGEFHLNKWNFASSTWDDYGSSIYVGGAGFVHPNAFKFDPNNEDNWWIFCNGVKKMKNGQLSTYNDYNVNFHADARDLLVIGNKLLLATDGGVYRSQIGTNDHVMSISSEGLGMAESESVGLAQSPPFYVASGFWHAGLQVYNPSVGEWHYRLIGDGTHGYIPFLDNEVFIAGDQQSNHEILKNYDLLHTGGTMDYIRASENVYDLYFGLDDINASTNVGLKYWYGSSNLNSASFFQNGNGANIEYEFAHTFIREIPNAPNKVSTLQVPRTDVFGVRTGGVLRIFDGVTEINPALNIINEFITDDVYKEILGITDPNENPGANPVDYVFDPRGNGDFYLVLNGSPDFQYQGRGRIVKYDASSDIFIDISKPADDAFNSNDPYFPAWISINDIEMDRQTGRLYIGTAHGVYYLDETANEWINYSPNVPMINTQINIRHCTGEIFASTTYRGIWHTNLKRDVSTPTLEWNITANETWDSRVNLFCTLVIEPGATLTVKDELIVYGNQKIIVKPGGKLRVIGGHITSNCGDFWKGIEVWGSSSLEQTAQNQGVLVINHQATIENARFAVRMWEPGNWLSTGGKLIAYNSTFKNNFKSVEYMPYHSFGNNGVENMNTGIVSNCKFIWTDDHFSVQGTHSATGISLYDVNGVRIQGNDFSDERTTLEYASDHATGVVSADASYRVIGRSLALGAQSTTQHTEYNENGYDISNFENMYRGVHVMNFNSQAAVIVDHCKFLNSQIGIELNAADNAHLTRNFFHTDYQHVDEITQPIGMLLKNATAFNVEGNIFDNDIFVSSGSGVELGQGVVVDNSSIENNRIRRNSYSNLHRANVAFGVNTNDDDIEGGTEGLQWLCNDYQSSYYIDQAFVTGGAAINVLDEQGVRRMQGDPSEPAGNTFTFGNSSIPLDYNYLSEDPDEVKYYVNDALVAAPNLISGEIEVIQIPQQNECGTIFNDPIVSSDGKLISTTKKAALKGELSETINDLETALLTLQENIEDVNSVALYNKVANLDANTWAALHEELMEGSPYLNRDLMEILGNQSNPHYPHAWYTELVLANPELMERTSFLDYLQNKTIPLPSQYYSTILNSRFDVISAYGDSYNEITMLEDKKRRLANLLLINEVSDTLAVDWDEFIDLTQQRNDFMRLQQLVDLHLGLHDVSVANDYLDSISNLIAALPNAYNKKNMASYFTVKEYILDSLIGNSGVVEGIDSLAIVQLLQYKNNYEGLLGGAQAINILCFHAGMCEDALMYQVQSGRGKSLEGGSWEDEFTEDITLSNQYVVMPNPNDGIFMVQKPEGVKLQEVMVFGSDGRKISFDMVQQNENSFKIILKNPVSGVYYLHLIDEFNVRYVEKISIN
jgi:hypothetical protein